MAVNAGNTILNSFVPPFKIHDTLADGQALVYSEECKAFINVGPTPPPAICDHIKSRTIVSDGTNSFYLDWLVKDVKTVWVTINGVSQHKNLSYTISPAGSGSIITFSENVYAGDNIEVIDFMTYDFSTVDFYTVQTPAGGITEQVLPFKAQDQKNLFITIRGIKQQEDAYTLDNSQPNSKIIWSETIPEGEIIQYQVFPDLVENTVLIKAFPIIGTETEFTVPWPVPGKDSIYVSLQGVKQQSQTFDLVVNSDSSTIILQQAPVAGQVLEIIGLITDFSCYDSGDVEVVGRNIGYGASVYTEKSVSLDEHVLMFRGISAGNFLDINVTDFDIELSLSDYINDQIVTLGDRVTGLEGQPVLSQNFANHLTTSGIGYDMVSKGDPMTDGVISVKSIGQGDGITIFETPETLYISASTEVGYKGVTSTIAMVPEDKIIGVADTSSYVTVTLPPVDGVPVGKIYIIKDESGQGASQISVVPNEVSTIDGQSAYQITGNYGVCQVYSNGTNWFKV